MTRALLVSLGLLVASLLASGCCDCNSGPSERGPKRPGDVVRELRDAIADHRWGDARACFSDELRERFAARMLSGEWFSVRAHRALDTEGRPCPCATEPASPRIVELEVAYPLGSGDSVLSVEVAGDDARATIEPAHPTHLAGARAGERTDPRPKILELHRIAGAWKIVALEPSREAETARAASPGPR